MLLAPWAGKSSYSWHPSVGVATFQSRMRSLQTSQTPPVRCHFQPHGDTGKGLRRQVSLHPASQSCSSSIGGMFPSTFPSTTDMEMTPCAYPFMPRRWDPISHQRLQSYQPLSCAKDGWRAGPKAPFLLTGALITKVSYVLHHRTS